MPFIKWLLAGLSPWRPGFDTGESMWDVWCTKWHLNRFSSYYAILPPVSIILPTLHTRIHLNAIVIQIHNQAKPGNLQKSNFLSEMGERWIQKHFQVFKTPKWLNRRLFIFVNLCSSWVPPPYRRMSPNSSDQSLMTLSQHEKTDLL